MSHSTKPPVALEVLDNTLLAALITFAVGTLALCVLVLMRSTGSSVNLQALSGVSPGLLIGGVLGATYVAIMAFLVPKIGLANTARGTDIGVGDGVTDIGSFRHFWFHHPRDQLVSTVGRCVGCSGDGIGSEVM